MKEPWPVLAVKGDFGYKLGTVVWHYIRVKSSSREDDGDDMHAKQRLDDVRQTSMEICEIYHPACKEEFIAVSLCVGDVRHSVIRFDGIPAWILKLSRFVIVSGMNTDLDKQDRHPSMD